MSRPDRERAKKVRWEADHDNRDNAISLRSKAPTQKKRTSLLCWVLVSFDRLLCSWGGHIKASIRSQRAGLTLKVITIGMRPSERM